MWNFNYYKEKLKNKFKTFTGYFYNRHSKKSCWATKNSSIENLLNFLHTNIYIICLITLLLVSTYVYLRFGVKVGCTNLNEYKILKDYGVGKLFIEGIDASNCKTHFEVLSMIDRDCSYNSIMPGRDFIMVFSKINDEISLSVREISSGPTSGTLAHWALYGEFHKDPSIDWGHLFYKGKWHTNLQSWTVKEFGGFIKDKQFQEEYLKNGACVIYFQRDLNLPSNWMEVFFIKYMWADHFKKSSEFFHSVEKFKRESCKKKKK